MHSFFSRKTEPVEEISTEGWRGEVGITKLEIGAILVKQIFKRNYIF